MSMDRESILVTIRSLADAKIVAILWVALDIVIAFDFPGDDSSILQLRFHSITSLSINMNFGQLVGQPLLWDSTIELTSEGRWNVLLDFGGAPDGRIEFTCCGVSESKGSLIIE
jgi:hypothetical protein